MVRLKNLTAGYGTLEVLHSVSMHISKGEIVALVGANGAGKSTLINSISGFVDIYGGEIEVNGENTTGSSPNTIVIKGCSQVPEGRQVFAPLSVEENLELGGYIPFVNGKKDIIKQTKEEILEIFPVLRERYRQFAGTLSGGEQQMLAMARALLARPKVLMLDEPSMGLAPLMVKEIFSIITRLRDTGVTVLLVEQNATAALKIADRAYVLETGRIALEGSADELLNNKEVQRAYLGKEYTSINE